ncbi:MAG TPA: hypothetical protein ENH41_02415 [Candidatus Omnitrophica bacterium]|nr:hypothetical protein [Candidatus Omnitrophota bacterium]
MRGATLLLAIIVLSSLALIGMSLVSLTLSRITSIDLEVDRVKALYLAEAGIARSLYELKKGIDVDNDGMGIISPTKFADGEFSVTYNSALFTFTATGKVNGVERSIQLKCVGG